MLGAHASARRSRSQYSQSIGLDPGVGGDAYVSTSTECRSDHNEHRISGLAGEVDSEQGAYLVGGGVITTSARAMSPATAWKSRWMTAACAFVGLYIQINDRLMTDGGLCVCAVRTCIGALHGAILGAMDGAILVLDPEPEPELLDEPDAKEPAALRCFVYI